jgi:hypothetical protein
MGTLDAQAAVRADARFEAMVDESFSILLPTADDFSLAKRYISAGSKPGYGPETLSTWPSPTIIVPRRSTASTRYC